MEKKPEKNLGIYIHIPFCASRCAYCDFYSLADCDKLIPEYEAALIRHIRESTPQLEGYLTDSVYFGGGTPSYFGAERLIRILDALKECGNVLMDAEITAEVNPDSITLRDMTLLRKAGFNRLSIGAQSANDGTLKSIGRRHTFAQVVEAAENARKAGFSNISMDLIYGLPSETKDIWSDSLSRVMALKPEHISCYGLKIEKGTPLYLYKDSPFIPDDDAQADMYLYAVSALERFGYQQYEISNFAMRGFRSVHNLKYWKGEEYLGFGAAAHSYIGRKRYSTLSDAAKYCENIQNGGPVIDQCETITDFERAGEYIMLGLRTADGVCEEEYRAIYPSSFDGLRKLMTEYRSHGWMTEHGGRWSFTPSGFLLSNVLIGNLLSVRTTQRTLFGAADGAESQISFSDSEESQENLSLFQGIS